MCSSDLMPAERGWRGAAVPQQACRFREPLWMGPTGGPEAITEALSGFPSQEADVQVLGLQPFAAGSTDVILTVQNLGPARRRLRLGDGWDMVCQLNGLHEALPSANSELSPWSLGFWRLRLSPRARQRDQ